MNAGDIRDAVYDSLAPLLVPKGFELHDQRYRRVLRAVRQTVCAHVVNFAPRFEFALAFCFRADAAEAVLLQFVDVPPQFREMTETCCVTLDQLVPSVGRRIAVNNNRSLQRALSELIPAIGQEVLQFLETHKDLHGIDRLMNGSTREWFVSAQDPYFSMNSVIVAFLAGNPDREQIVSTHRERLRGNVSDQSLATYERIVHYLSHLP
jgi:hypothetical protein